MKTGLCGGREMRVLTDDGANPGGGGKDFHLWVFREFPVCNFRGVEPDILGVIHLRHRHRSEVL